MAKMLAILLCTAYLALIPLCFLSSEHPSQVHATHESDHAVIPSQLAPHTLMYESVTFAIIVMLVFVTAAFSNYGIRAHALVPDIDTLLVMGVLSRDALTHPHILLRRLSLFEHAPPLRT